MSLKIAFPGYRHGFPGEIWHKMPWWYSGQKEFELFDGTQFDPEVNRGPADNCVGPGTEFPFGMTMEKAAEFKWRIKTFYFDHNIGMTVHPFYPGLTRVYDKSGYSSADMEVYEAKLGDSREANLCIVNHSTVTADVYGGTGSWSWDDGEGGSNSGSNMYITMRLYTGGSMRFFNGLYYPRIFIGVWYSAPLLGLSLVSNVRTQWTFDGSTYDAADLGEKIQFWDFDPLTLWGHRAGSNQSHRVTAAVGTIDVQPISWWGYGGKWNTATGERQGAPPPPPP